MADNAAIAEAEMLAEKGYDASDPEQVNQARKKASRKKKESLEVIAALMEHEAGRRWLYTLLIECDVFRGSFLFGEPSEATAFREGKRFIGLQVFSDIRKASPQKFNMMLDEGDSRKAANLFPSEGLS